MIDIKRRVEKLTFNTLNCMVCKKEQAVWRISIPLWGIEIYPCLCNNCAQKPVHQIIEEVLKNG